MKLNEGPSSWPWQEYQWRFQAVICFVFDRCLCLFLNHTRLKTTALDHKTINDPVKDGTVKVATLYIFQKVSHSLGGFFSVQFQFDIAEIGVQYNHRVTVISVQMIRERKTCNSRWLWDRCKRSEWNKQPRAT